MKFSLAGLRRHPVLLCVPAQPALHAALAEQLERFFALQFLPPLSAQQRPQLLALLHDKAGLIAPAIPGGVDAALLAQLPRGAGIVNLARGAHVVDADLLAMDRTTLTAALKPLEPNKPHDARMIKVRPPAIMHAPRKNLMLKSTLVLRSSAFATAERRAFATMRAAFFGITSRRSSACSTGLPRHSASRRRCA